MMLGKRRERKGGLQDAVSRVYGTAVDHTAERHDVPSARVERTSKEFESS